MRQPPAFIHPQYPSYVCKLKKAIYGLKQAPRAWYNSLRDFLISYGFCNSFTDTSLFVYKHGDVLAYFLVYINDLLLTDNTTCFLDKFMIDLAARFSLKNLGFPNYFLGLELSPTKSRLFLSQQGYIRDLLEKANMSGAKPITTPMSVSCTLPPDSPPTDT